jgi:acylphosphatase
VINTSLKANSEKKQMTTTEEPVRSQSPELGAMTLPKLKTVATQLGVDGAAKMKKDALVEAIADLQAKNRDAAKAELIAIKIQMMMAMRIQRPRAVMISATTIAAAVMIAMIVGVGEIAIATAITATVHHAKIANQFSVMTMF